MEEEELSFFFLRTPIYTHPPNCLLLTPAPLCSHLTGQHRFLFSLLELSYAVSISLDGDDFHSWKVPFYFFIVCFFVFYFSTVLYYDLRIMTNPLAGVVVWDTVFLDSLLVFFFMLADANQCCSLLYYKKSNFV